MAFFKRRLGPPPDIALVLGSGLGDFVEQLADRSVLPFDQIPNFPVSTVVGHSGQLTHARTGDGSFCALQGRVHLYEGVPPSEVVFAVRALGFWGVDQFVITNAAGAVNLSFRPGDFMLIRDHINLQGDNPLCGPNLDLLGPRFPDMTEAYDSELRKSARHSAKELAMELREGVYVAVKGPSYETPAEITLCRTLGADAVGMSTVPEVIALNHMGKRVLGISCITNMAAGILPQKMRHEEVLETTSRIQSQFARLILNFLEGGVQ